MKKGRILIVGLVVAGFIMTLGGCALKENSIQIGPASAVAFFHGSPNGPDLDVALNDAKLNSSVFAYKSFSNYVQLNPGDKKITLSTFGGTDKLLDTTYTFQDARAYSVFIANKKTSTSSTAIETFLVDDTYGSTPAATSCLIRFVHLSPDAPAVNVTLKNGSAISGLATIASFKSHTPFSEFTPLSYTAEVRRASDDTLLLTIPLNTNTGIYYTILMIGFVNPPNGNTNSLSYKVVN